MSRTVFRTTLLAAALSTGLALMPTSGALAAPEGSTAMAATGHYGLPDFSDLVTRVGPAVVNISVVQEVSGRGAYGGIDPNDPFYDFLRRFGVPVPGTPGVPMQPDDHPQVNRGIGSGFIVSSDGYVLTNTHVVDDATEVTVRLTDKREFKAKVIGTDKRTDVALLKIDADHLPTVDIGNAENARVGEWVIAVGSPFGFDNTVTAGIISAKARRLPDETYVPFLQTDVAINPGNSGGPLFNLKGEVIGINSQIYSRSGGFMGISFAIPIDVAMGIKEQLQKFGKVQRGRLGVMIQGLDKELAQSFGLDDDHGALVSSVDPESPAAEAGLKAGDIVLSVDGRKLENSSELPRLIGEKRPGTTVALDIWSDRQARKVDVVLGELSGDGSEAGATGIKNDNTGGKLGLTARALSRQEAAQLGVDGGLVIEHTTGAAAKAGLRAGDIILALNNQPIGGVSQFRSLLDKAGKRFALLVKRGDGRIYVPIRLD